MSLKKLRKLLICLFFEWKNGREEMAHYICQRLGVESLEAALAQNESVRWLWNTFNVDLALAIEPFLAYLEGDAALVLQCLPLMIAQISWYGMYNIVDFGVINMNDVLHCAEHRTDALRVLCSLCTWSNEELIEFQNSRVSRAIKSHGDWDADKLRARSHLIPLIVNFREKFKKKSGSDRAPASPEMMRLQAMWSKEGTEIRVKYREFIRERFDAAIGKTLSAQSLSQEPMAARGVGKGQLNNAGTTVLKKVRDGGAKLRRAWGEQQAPDAANLEN